MFPNRSAILLRKMAGRFDAVRNGAFLHGTPSVNHTLTGTLGGMTAGFALLLLPLLLIAAAVAMLSLHPIPAMAAMPMSKLSLVAVAGTTEIAKVRDEIMAAFDQFRKANDERLDQIQAKGSADPLLVQKVEAANADISKLTAQLKELETAQARSALRNEEPTKEKRALIQRAREFLAVATGRRLREVKDSEVDLTVIGDAYVEGMDNYLRTGRPQDAMSVGTSPEGGYWVSPDRTGRIVEFLYQTSPMRQYADVVTTTKDAKEGWTDLEEFGVSTTSESGTRSGNTDTADLGKWRIPVHEMYAEPRLTQQMIDDSDQNMEEWSGNKVSRKFARTENNWFVNGTGVGQATGFIKYANASAPTSSAWQRVQYIKTGANGAFAGSNPADKIVDLVHALKSELRQGAIFAANNLTLAEIRKLKDGQGNYLLQPIFTNGLSGQVLGFGAVEFPDMPDIAANSYSVAFANFKEGYTIVDRLGIRMLRDPLTLKGWVKFYTTKRVGGDVTNFEAIKLLKFAA